MATTSNKTTSANILASLGIKGASLLGGPENAGKTPILDSDGLLDVSLLPTDKLSREINIPYLDNTAYVNPLISDDPDYKPTGSIVSPFRTLEEAAASDKAFSNFILVSADAVRYKTEQPVFTTREKIIRIFSTGTATFTDLILSWVTPTTFILSNITVTSKLKFSTKQPCYVYLTGTGYAGTVQGAVDNPSDPDISTIYVKTVYVDSGYSVSNFSYCGDIVYLSSGDRITNGSTVVPGKTVTDAISRLGNRRIRIPKFSADSSGVHADATEDVVVYTDSSDEYDVHDITAIGSTLVEALNDTFYKKNDSPVFSNLFASAVIAAKIISTSVSTERLKLGTVPVYVDSDNFLSIGDAESSDSYDYPRNLKGKIQSVFDFDGSDFMI